MLRRVLDRIVHEERGGVLVIVAGFLPLAIVIAAFVIDVGNAMEHDRHLQLQADAAALAAASEFEACRNDPDGANQAIEDRVLEYAGEGSSTGPARNLLVHDQVAQDRVNYIINGTDFSSASYSAGEPCETGFIDVKLVEEGSPAFFGFVGNHDYKGHARIQALKLNSLNGLLPLAVPVPDPKSAAAIFVREDTGAVLQTAPLLRAENEDTGGLSMYKTTAAANVPIPTKDIGVRIALSGSDSTTCGAPLVTCYDAGATTKGLAYIRGFLNTGDGDSDPTNGEPKVKSVTLQPATPACEDVAFMPSFSPAVPGCATNKRQLAITAIVDFDGKNASTVGGTVTPVVNGVTGPQLASDGSSTFTGVISVPSGTGPIGIDLNWEQTQGKIPPNGGNNAQCKTGNGNKCLGTFPAVQRHFRTDETRSGPIGLLQVSEQNGAAHVNSFARCSPGCSHSLNVKIGLTGTLKLDSPGDPATHLRLSGTNQTQALGCTDGNDNLTGELVGGCVPFYTVNKGTTCPNNANGVLSLPKPWECVGLLTGNKTNQIASGLNERILGDEKANTCTAPNNWPDFDDADPRVILVFLTSFGAFSGTGSGSVPVTGFAAFYVTGWNAQGSGFSNPCQGNGDDPAAAAGEIVGHYVPHIKVPNDGGAGTDPCAPFNSIRPCTPVLVE